MRAGTKTVLFGTHQFILHPIFVFAAWLIRYHSFPKLHQLLAIAVHDLGLLGRKDVDGTDGERHPQIVHDILEHIGNFLSLRGLSRISVFFYSAAAEVIGHSRFYVINSNGKYNLSMLFQADKLGSALYPSWLYIPLGLLSGEIREYQARADDGKYKSGGQFGRTDVLTWFLDVRSRLAIMGLDRDVAKYMQVKNHWNA